MIPGSANPLLLKSAAAAAGGYQIERSLRFNSSDSAYLSRTPASAGNRRTWTWAGWVKRSALDTAQTILDILNGQAGQPRGGIYFTSDNFLNVSFNSSGGSWDSDVTTTSVYRDVSAWFHLLVAFDVTQATASNRVKIYVNGSQLTSFSTATYPTNTDQPVNNTVQHRIGLTYNNINGLNGYLADIHFIDGQALTPSSFTEVSATTGQLIPKAYTGTYTGNSFWLKFSDNSAATATTLGKDSFLLGNNWTPNNFSVVGGPNTVTIPASNAPPTLDYLVVAGGGGGSSGPGGGGGAGGLRSTVTATGGGGSLESPLSVTAGLQYTVTVGAGGSGGSDPSVATSGGDSVFASVTSIGGGRGGSNYPVAYEGANGGSGGGARNNGAGTAPAGTGTANQGFAGGTAATGSSGNRPTGGGGGAGAVGANGTSGAAGNGGAGVAVAITGSSVTYAGGGGGGSSGAVTAGSGGAGGGGAGGQAGATGTSGTPNTGGGGGGSDSAPGVGGNGGSGIVIIRYANTYADLTVGGGLTYTYANTGGYKIYSFTASAIAAQSAGNDSLVDTPTSYGTDTGAGGEVRGNYATLNPIGTVKPATGVIPTLTNGNLDAAHSGGSWQYANSTIAVPAGSGKYYCEFYVSSSYAPDYIAIGVNPATASTFSATVHSSSQSGIFYSNNGEKWVTSSNSAYGSAYTTGDIIGVALNCDSGQVTFYKNNTSQGAISFNSNLTNGGTIYFTIDIHTSNLTANFGQRSWAYAAPSGFRPLVDTLLPAPVVAKPNTVMDVKLYDGNGSTQTISGLGFSPDFVWCKGRSGAAAHTLTDSVRGTNSQLFSNRTDAQETVTDALTAFNSDGFSLGANTSGVYPHVNVNGYTYAAWCWDAGTSTVSNTAGSITSSVSVRANASAGFSIVTYTGNGTNNATVGHSLGVAPELVLFKRRSGTAQDWGVYHVSGGRKNLQLNTTGAYLGGGATYWDAIPTSTVIYPDNVYVADHYQNVTGETYVAYCWAPVAGYSSFGSYTGNGSTDGPFVYTGFRPRWVMVKRTDAARDWFIYDAARNTYNIVNNFLRPNLSDAEGTSTLYPFDFLSNGFKLRSSETDINGSGGTWIYAAFAENPFQYARAR